MRSLSNNIRHRLCTLALVCLLANGQIVPALAARSPSNDAACEALDLKVRSSPSGENARELNFFLFDAAAQGCLALAEQLLQAGASIKARDRFGNTALLIAARMGHTDLLNELIDRGADPHQKNLAGSSSLLRAVTMNRRKTVKRLLQVGVDPNAANATKVTPLITSVYNGHQKITRLLVESGANPTTTDASGKGPIVYASGKGYLAIVKLLLETGEVDVNTAYGNDLTALMWAAGHSNDVPEQEGLKTVAYLLEQGADFNATDNRQKTALMIAAERGHALIVAYLLSQGASTSLLDHKGRDAIGLASTVQIRALIQDADK